MTWDPSLPANNSLVRLSPGYIRTNWNAIQEGEVPYKKLQLSKQVANPTRANDIGWLYVKQINSQEELFYQDDRNPALVTQITKNNRIGTPTQGVNASNFIMDSTGFTYGINQMIVATGSFNSSGALVSGVNMVAVSHTGTGRYTVAINADVVLNANYKVLVSCLNDGSFSDSERVINIVTKGAVSAGNPVNIQLGIRSGGGTANDQAFEVIIVGGR